MEDEAVNGMMVEVDHDLKYLDDIPNEELFQLILKKLDEVPPHTGYDLLGLKTAQIYVLEIARTLKHVINRMEREQVRILATRLKSDHEKLENRIEGITHKKERKKKSSELMKLLNIPYYVTHEDAVRITDLYDILMDEDKLSDLVAKLKLKAFW